MRAWLDAIVAGFTTIDAAIAAAIIATATAVGLAIYNARKSREAARAVDHWR